MSILPHQTKMTIDINRENANNINFFLDGNVQDFSQLGIEVTEEMLSEEQSRARTHQRLIDLFEIDSEKLELFKEMITNDPNGGYSNFIQRYLI